MSDGINREKDKMRDQRDTAERKAKSTLENLERIIAFMPGSVYWKNTEGVYIGCNDIMAEIFNLPKDQVLGKSDAHLLGVLGLSEKQIESIINLDKKVMAEGIPQLNIEEPMFHCPDGRIINQISNKVPILDEHGSVVGILGISIDVSEKKKLEEELGESKVREDRLKVLSGMGGMIAHELRTPLTGITFGITAIEKRIGELIDVYQRWSIEKNEAPISRQKISELEQISKDIKLSLSQIDNTIDTVLAGFKQDQVNPSQLKLIKVDDLFKKFLEQYPLSKHESDLVSVKYNPGLVIKGISEILLHILANLVKNSLYCIQEVNKGEITLWAEQKNHQVEIHVKDTAKGIAPDNLNKIFEPFFTTKDSATSIGMGLYFCKLAIKSLGGEIECRSTGEITEFTLVLPIGDNTSIA